MWGNVLSVPRANDTNTTSSNVGESDMEATEIVADNDEDSIRFPGVLDLREEVWSQAERQRDLSGLVEVGLENAPGKQLEMGS